MSLSQMTSVNEIVMEIGRMIQHDTENIMLNQLDDFVSRGLIEVQMTQPVLIQEPMANKLRVVQSVKLVLKDKEYIEKLENENKELKELLDALKKAFGGIA